MLIGLIRHGLTDWNAVGRIQGQSDIPLNEEGRRQAGLLADRLKNEQEPRWDFVITSGLSRAQETGSILAQTLGIPLLDPDSRIVERSFGQVEGLTSAEREARWGKDWILQDLGQETEDQLRARALSFLQEMEEKYGGSNVLVVSHGALLAQMYEALFPQQCTERIGNLSLTILENHAAEWKLNLYNCTRHLEYASKEN
ncbi:histidine phosphatase family protein [Paenibacillus brevis]|uniref:Histidine phosphatase family protein n=1 Tax=Paenibacillus brevis TaxID=2841508 RepID=A0ABS6FRG1_9BACL|nr:histidine phosphatase family protein [Paenibacillus brevis]MBU5672788.1 histidine phosphatase family protein [Paenibacillus brevis]